jgi:hypothetical protein
VDLRPEEEAMDEETFELRIAAEQRADVAEATTNEYDYGMPVHPVCDLFPLMTASELDHLVDDIQTHGQTNPIVVHTGQLVDGRNRLLACRRVGVGPSYVQWRAIYHGDETVAQWIWSANAERRHLTADQWLAILGT